MHGIINVKMDYFASDSAQPPARVLRQCRRGLLRKRSKGTSLSLKFQHENWWPLKGQCQLFVAPAVVPVSLPFISTMCLYI